MSFQAYIAANIYTKLEECKDPLGVDAQKLRLVLSNLGFDPLPPHVRKLIHNGRDGVYQAFWECFVSRVTLEMTESRLFINPPKGLVPMCTEAVTITTQSSLRGCYGPVVDPPNLPLYRSSLSRVFFDDVTVFWCQGLTKDSEIRAITDAISPGSTITLVAPTAAHHGWMSYYEIENGNNHFMEEVVEKFRMTSIWKNKDPDVVIETIGIESPT